MWSACVGVSQLLNWKMHGETLTFLRACLLGVALCCVQVLYCSQLLAVAGNTSIFPCPSLSVHKNLVWFVPLCPPVPQNIRPDFQFSETLSRLRLIYYRILLTYSMEQNTSWEANRFSASQEIPCILWNPKVLYRIYKYTPPVPMHSQIIPVHTPNPLPEDPS